MFSNEAVWIFQRAAPCCLEPVELETVASAALCHAVAARLSGVYTRTAPSPRLSLIRVASGCRVRGNSLHRLVWQDWILFSSQVSVHPVILGWDLFKKKKATML